MLEIVLDRDVTIDIKPSVCRLSSLNLFPSLYTTNHISPYLATSCHLLSPLVSSRNLHPNHNHK